MTLACEDANSKLVEVAIIANVDDEDRVGNSLLHTAYWSLVNILPLMSCRGYEDESWLRCKMQGLVNILNFKFSRGGDVWCGF